MKKKKNKFLQLATEIQMSWKGWVISVSRADRAAFIPRLTAERLGSCWIDVMVQNLRSIAGITKEDKDEQNISKK